MLPVDRGARTGGRLVGRPLVKFVGGSAVHGLVRGYSAAFDAFTAAWEDGRTERLSWDALEERLPVLPAARAAVKEKRGASAVAQAGRAACRALRPLLAALVAADRHAHADEKRGVLAALHDRCVSDAEALRRVAGGGNAVLVTDALKDVAAAAEGDEARGLAAVDVLVSQAACVGGAGPHASAVDKQAAQAALVALWRVQSGGGGREDLESAAAWAVEASGATMGPKTKPTTESMAKTEPKTEPKATTESKVAEEKRRVCERRKDDGSRKRARGDARPSRPPAPPPEPSPVSPPGPRRPLPRARTPQKKPRPLLRTARGKPVARRVRFSAEPRVIPWTGAQQ